MLELARCVWRESVTDRTMMVAAGLAFFGLFGLLPSVAIVGAVYRLYVGDAAIEDQLRALGDVLPEGTPGLLVEFLTAGPENLGIGFGLALNFIVVLWMVQRSASGLITALNVVYEVDEKRGRIRRELVALAIALGALAFLFVALFLVAVLPLLASALPALDGPAMLLRWPVLGVLFFLSLGLLYNFAPSRERADWRWIGWGAAAATVLWVAASILFSLYMEHVGGWSRFYGSVTALVVLMTWMFISAFVVMVGAEVSAQLAARAGERPSRAIKSILGRREARH